MWIVSTGATIPMFYGRTYNFTSHSNERPIPRGKMTEITLTRDQYILEQANKLIEQRQLDKDIEAKVRELQGGSLWQRLINRLKKLIGKK